MIYQTIVRFVDIETGEEISKQEYINNYIKIKSTKHAKEPDFQHGIRIIELITECRRKPQQGKLKFTNPRNRTDK